MYCAGGGLHGRGRLRKSFRSGARGESRRAGECCRGRQEDWRETPVSQFRLRVRRQEYFTLRNRGCAESAERVRTVEGGGGGPVAASAAGVLHRANFVVVWDGREMLPGHDSETGGKPSGAGCGE